jgi:hypothetical protein
MLDYPANCPSGTGSLPPAPPVLGAYADASYYTQGDTGIIAYTAADVTSLSLNETPSTTIPGVYSCGTSEPICSGAPPAGSCPAALYVGSCSALYVTMTNTTSQITLEGQNADVADTQSSAGPPLYASANAAVGPGPIVGGIQDYTNGQSCNLSENPSCTITASQDDTLEIYGEGFDPSGGDTVEFNGSGGTQKLFMSDGYFFWDPSRTQINAQIGCFISPGSWTFAVYNPNSGTPSAGYPINIVSSSSCQ